MVRGKIEQSGRDIKGLFTLIIKRDFSGYTGLAIKNSLYQFSTTFVSKAGSLIFTILLARLLMPELFGLYNLALSTILIFVSFSDLGIGQTLVKYVSGSLGKGNNAKAKRYYSYLFRMKILLLLVSALILAGSSYLISTYYYQKPIFLALLAGVFYLFFVGILQFVQFLFHSENKFKFLLLREILFQITRLIIIPLVIIYYLRNISSGELKVGAIILLLSFTWFLMLVFLSFAARKEISFIHEKTGEINLQEKNKLNKFAIKMAAFSLSGFFFGYIDMFFLGRFVLSEYVGFYSAAFSLVSGISPLILFSSALFPIFSRISGKRLERAFNKSLLITTILSVLSMIILFFISPFLINLLYGETYAASSSILRILSLLIFSLPLIGLYTSYYIAKGRPGPIAKIILVSTFVNIILNYFLIVWLIRYGQLAAVFGVSIATLISSYLCLISLILCKPKK